MDKLYITEQDALKYHRKNGKAGKIGVHATKPLLSQRDLSLAYSPGVAYPCQHIAKNKDDAYLYTSKGNMVAVISNGTAVLGLGNLGAIASKPVMEGKAVLFKQFADIDAIDIEVDTLDPQEFIDTVKNIGASWGGINLEDIKAPECFIIERELKKIMDVPIFHDDQHGTAIITAAGLINAAHLTNRKFSDLRIVVNGAGAAAIACIELLKLMGVQHNNVILCDTRGVIYKGRTEGMNEWKEKHAAETSLRTLEDAMKNADVFLGLSVKGAVSTKMVQGMAKQPIIFAMANPDPEITPDEVQSVRDDAIIATGRSDFNNQVNNVMGFPYIFRGALDVRAKHINEEMKIAAAHAIADLAREPIPDEVASAYAGKKLQYGPEYIIPAPFDPRLITTIPLAVAKAALDSGVARVTEINIEDYKKKLASRLNPAANYMSSIFERVTNSGKTVAFAEGESEIAIKAAISVRDNHYGKPILVGRSNRILEIIDTLGSSYNLDGIEIVNAATIGEEKLNQYIERLYSKLQRQGLLHRDCARMVKTDRNIFTSLLVDSGDVDCMVTGGQRKFNVCLDEVRTVIDNTPDEIFSYAVMINKGCNTLIADTNVHNKPSATALANIAKRSAEIVHKMGETPSVAFLSCYNFDNTLDNSYIKDALQILTDEKVSFEFDGAMAPNVALDPELMKLYPFSKLSQPANILIMPDLNSAAISTKLLQQMGSGTFLGPILTGFNKSVQIAQIGASSSQLILLASFAIADTLD